MTRGPSRWWTSAPHVLSSQGVELAMVAGLGILKVLNIAQMVITVSADRESSGLLAAEVAAAAVFAASGAALVAMSVRARRLSRPWVVLDAFVAVAVIVAAPLFRPLNPEQPWTDWPIAVTLLVPADVCVGVGWAAGIGVALVCMGAVMSWLLWDPPALTRQVLFTSFIPYMGFAVGVIVFVHYLRSLAALADARGKTIQVLMEERTRRVLHTPYRLLNDLAAILASETQDEPPQGGDGAYSARRAHLAEALASVREIEAIVRGTEPASSNLSADLTRLQEQFADLPLLMNVEDVAVDLPAWAVYRIREAVRSALQNVRLHAQASEVVVYATADAAQWLVSVHDDGRGFEPASVRRGVGLTDLIQGALTQIGATVSICSAPGEGTLVEMAGDHRWTLDPDRA